MFFAFFNFCLKLYGGHMPPPPHVATPLIKGHIRNMFIVHPWCKVFLDPFLWPLICFEELINKRPSIYSSLFSFQTHKRHLLILLIFLPILIGLWPPLYNRFIITLWSVLTKHFMKIFIRCLDYNAFSSFVCPIRRRNLYFLKRK